jgi:hypothetical protein
MMQVIRLFKDAGITSSVSASQLDMLLTKISAKAYAAVSAD